MLAMEDLRMPGTKGQSLEGALARRLLTGGHLRRRDLLEGSRPSRSRRAILWLACVTVVSAILGWLLALTGM